MQSTENRKFRDQFKMFNLGSAKYKAKSTPLISDLLTYVTKKSNRKRVNNNKSNLEATASEICSAKSKAGQRVRELVQAYKMDGKYGSVPRTKRTSA